MLQNDNITASKALLMPNIGNGLSNIFNTFSSNGKKDVTMFKILRVWYIFKLGM